MLKAQLQEKLDLIEEQVEKANKRASLAQQDERDAQDELEAALNRFGALKAWDCPNSPGDPVCIVGPEDDIGLGLNVYLHAGEIVGVEVYERTSACPFLARVGLVPAITDVS